MCAGRLRPQAAAASRSVKSAESRDVDRSSHRRGFIEQPINHGLFELLLTLSLFALQLQPAKPWRGAKLLSLAYSFEHAAFAASQLLSDCAGAAGADGAGRSSRANFSARRMFASSELLSKVRSLKQFGHCI
jgi:hypothetical protein